MASPSEEAIESARRSLGTDRRAVELTVALGAGLIAGAPLFAWVVRRLDLPLPLPLLVGVAVIGAAYSLLTLGLRRITAGLGVALVVTVTFAANVPLTAAAGNYPGNLGPQVWLFEVPLLATAAILLARGAYERSSFTRTEYALGCFVAWTAVAAIMGQVVRMDTALYFTLFALLVWLGFGVASRIVGTRILPFRSVLVVFLLAVLGQAAFAGLQLLNRGPFGFTYLGETPRNATATVVDLGALGTHPIGVFVSGFTGGNGPMAGLLVLAIPVALAATIRARGLRRGGWVLATVGMAVVLRATGKDAARGALVIGLCTFGALAAWTYWARRDGALLPSAESAGALGGAGAAVLASMAVVGYPSSKSGAVAEFPASAPGGTGAEATVTPFLADVSIPLFNLKTFGLRFQQYAAGLDLFVRNPLFGIGGANYPYVAPRYGLGGALRGEPFPIHNWYVALLAETGLPGFVLATVAVLFGLRTGLGLLHGSREPLLVSAVLGGLVGYLAVAFWIVNVRFTMVLPFVLLLGALVGAARKRDRDEGDAAGPEGPVTGDPV